MRSVTSRDILKVLKKMGWFEVNQVGSHKQFKHNSIKGRVTVPYPKKDIHQNTLKSILTQMCISLDEFYKHI